MEQAIPTVEWVDRLVWDADLKCSDDYWLPEEKCAINFVVHYGVINGQIEKTEQIKRDLKVFIQSTHSFINYKKTIHFDGFDWFLATVFLICNGNIDKLVLFYCFHSFILIRNKKVHIYNIFIASDGRESIVF